MAKGPGAAAEDLTAGDGRYAIVVARWNSEITETLLKGAVETFEAHGAGPEQIDVYFVPGSFELPQAAAQAAKTGKYVAVCTLGVVIQGETDHHDYINHAVARGLTQLGIETGVPILFGVLTVKNEEQAWARAGGEHGNKGAEAALAAMEMAAVYRRMV